MMPTTKKKMAQGRVAKGKSKSKAKVAAKPAAKKASVAREKPTVARGKPVKVEPARGKGKRTAVAIQP